MRRFSLLIIFTFLIPILISSALADEANYFYDDSGRLVRVAKGTEGIIYQYDEVGNLLSITKGTINTNASPVISSITPDVLFIGQTTPVIIKGQNLFTTKSITSSNPSLSIKTINVTDTEIKAEISVSSSASPGTANITVTTSYGSASIGVTLSSSKLSFSPGQLALMIGSSGSITATINPSLGKDLTIAIKSSDPSVVSAPELLTIPSSGTATFTVNALKEGISTISSGDTNTVVFVAGPSTPGSLPYGEEIVNKAGPVSVYIESLSGSPTISSSPVSAYIKSQAGGSSIASLPVSVYLNTPPGDASVVSLPVSTIIAKESITDASTQSLPVSIRIESSSVNASTMTLPVSAYIEPASSNNSTTASLPVSVYIEPATGNATIASLPVSVKISPQ